MTPRQPSRCLSKQSPTSTKSKPSSSSVSDSASPGKEADKPKGVRVVCSLCGKPYLKAETRIRENNFCCKAHLRSWNSRKMSEYNRLTNPMARLVVALADQPYMVKTYHPVWTITYTPGSCSINVSGTWRKGEPWVNISGTWRKGFTWTNIGGTWKQGK